MPAILLNLIGQLLPWLVGALAVVIGYFTIRQRGVLVERQRQEVAQAKAEQKLKERIEVAQSQDEKIDTKVQEKIDEIKKQEQPAGPDSGSRFVF